MPRKRKRTRRTQEPVYYVVEIENWDWSYSFGKDDRKHADEPYYEFRHLQLFGRLLRPRAVKAERAELTLMPDKRLNEENRHRDVPLSVGSLRLHRSVLYGLLPIPADALEPLLQVLIAERARYAMLSSVMLRYRYAPVQSFSIERQLSVRCLISVEADHSWRYYYGSTGNSELVPGSYRTGPEYINAALWCLRRSIGISPQ